MQTGEKINKVRVSLSYQQIALEYASQADADLDRNGTQPDLVIAIYCLETGRQKYVKSWLDQEKHNAKDFDLQDIYD